MPRRHDLDSALREAGSSAQATGKAVWVVREGLNNFQIMKTLFKQVIYEVFPDGTSDELGKAVLWNKHRALLAAIEAHYAIQHHDGLCESLNQVYRAAGLPPKDFSS
jgi:hypothetical protein